MPRFTFAWVDEGTPWSGALDREDEQVFALNLDQSEDSEFAQLDLDLRNPHIGLLNPGRQVWAWLGIDMGAGAQPLFYGRLVGVPDGPDGEVVRLAFEARPADYADQKAALAETLKVAPFWDPIWIAPDRRDDPDAVLEARPVLWHVDPVTHAVDITDVTSGEDGTVDLGGDVFEDSVSLQLGDDPLRAVTVQATVTWTQTGTGSVDLSESLCAAARAAGTTARHVITTLTGDGLVKDWPQPGDNIGGGWSVGASRVKRTDGASAPLVILQQVFALQGLSLSVPVWTLKPTFVAVADQDRSFIETVAFTLGADTQAIATDPGGDDALLLTLSSDGVDAPVDAADSDHPDGTLPIGDARRRTYLQTDRGHRSVEYLIALARTRILIRARAAEVTFETSFANGLLLSTRKNCRIADPRLPGGEATGKVIGLTLSADGATGEIKAGVRLGCMVGEGNTVTSDAGTPSYVEDGYAEDGWQVRQSEIVMPIAGAVTYENYDGTPIADDGLDFFDLRVGDVLESATVIDGITVQRAILAANGSDHQAALTALQQAFTEIDVKLTPLGRGPFQTDYALTVSELMVPKTIELSAGSTP